MKEFITHPLFVEYKSVLIPTIAVDSWEELIGTVSALIKKED